jgi:hypothetical protein
VGRIHALDRNLFRCAFKIHVHDEILDSINDLLEDMAIEHAQFKHGGGVLVVFDV